MIANVAEPGMRTLEIVKEETIAAPMATVFAAILAEMGPENRNETGPMPMVLEAWPGGRWFRDLGQSNGHFWGHVQAIKAPTLLEIHGPLFMSGPAMSNLQYRLSESNGVTLLKFTHRAVGIMPAEMPVERGWQMMIDRIKAAVAK